MGEAKFTKGDWRVEPFVNGNAYEIAYNDDCEVIAEYVYDLTDAHLIAAAPDTYHAAINAMSLLERLGLESSDEYQALKSATEKARGEN